MQFRTGITSKLRTAFGYAAVGLFLTGCDVPIAGTTSPSGNTGQTVNINESVKVALLVPSGSGDVNLDRIAANLTEAARLAVRDYSNVKIDLQVYGTGGDSARAAASARTAVNNGAQIIIGPLFAQAANAVGTAIASKNVNVLSFSNNVDIAGGNVFVLGNTFQNKANRIVGYAAAKGYRRIASVSPSNTVGQLGAKYVKQAASRAGVTYTGDFDYEPTPQGLTSASQTIASNIKSSRSTAIVLTADSDGGLAFLGRMLPASGVAPASVKYLGITRWDIPSSNLSTPGLNGGWFTLPDVRSAQQFNQRFNQAYGRSPHPLAGLAYDGISAVAKLLQSGNNKALTKSALTRTGGFRGTSGVFRLKADGTNQRALAIAEGSNGTFRIISGAPTSFSGSGS